MTLQDEIGNLLEELLDLEESTPLFISLYLDTSVNSEGHRVHSIYLKQKVADLTSVIAAGRGPAAVRDFRKNVAQIEQFLAQNLEKSTRGVALFSSTGRGYFKALQLPIPVRNKIAASRAPNLDILIELSQQNVHFCVVSFDRQAARILSVYLTDIVRERELSSPQISARSQPGSSSRVRYEWRERDMVKHFLRDLAGEIEDLMRTEETQGLVLLGTQANIAELRKLLSPEIDKQVILTQHVPTTTPDSQLIERVLAEVRRLQQELTRQSLVQLYDRLSQDYLSSVGVESTLFNLLQGKVQALIISGRFAQRGRKCPKCEALFAGAAMECVYCRTPTLDVDLRNQMEKVARNQGVKIEALQESSFLDHLGGVGALLRF